MINIKPNKNENKTNKNSNEKNKLNIKIAIGIALLLVVIVVIGLLVYFDNRFVMDNSFQSGNEEETEEPKPVYLGDVYTFPNPDALFNDDSLEESTRKFLVTKYFSYHGNEILKDLPEIADIENDMEVFNTQFLTLYDETGLVGYTLWTIKDGNHNSVYLKFVKKENPYVLEIASSEERVLHHIEIDIDSKSEDMKVSSIKELSDEEFAKVVSKLKPDEYIDGNLLGIGDESLEIVKDVRQGIRNVYGYPEEEEE